MIRQYVSQYNPSKIRVIPFPEGEDYGHGWWRFAWEVEIEPQTLPRGLRLPAPSPEFDDLAMVVAVWPHDPGHITVEALGKHEKLMGEEVAYISLLMQAIRTHYHGVAIDGHTDHPILGMAVAPEQE